MSRDRGTNEYFGDEDDRETFEPDPDRQRDDSFYKQERDALQKAIDEINKRGIIKIQNLT
jgi:hypothetical protein|tara:strand:- start:214 stop:393 length:180 start_codon:yes stop_codon:yes gene_type:complete